ncbi:hypothetical protein GCM10008090_23140 [Arenicella chitinivorans]|uniref:GreAB-C-like domain-containing protein n=1 Tax=Arenicella chitinivorans TaxID=1329800 RepID=A0A918RVK6_9GAMM|nr:hypothetical protein [Arenicella chitinivorans]GHA12594.1 hypothetical protein GCM10008090_23140 [Arenicella chitinivorans]
MTDSVRERKASAGVALTLISPLIRKTLINEKGFMAAYGLKSEAVITLGLGNPSFHRAKLFRAVPIAIASEEKIKLIDTEGRAWDLINDGRQGELPKLILSSGEDELILPDFSVLADDVSTRILSLEKISAEVNLPGSAKRHWRNILSERALEDDEVEVFHVDVQETPTNVGQTILGEITAGESSISTLVPNSRRYFERLVGVYDGSATIHDYAVGGVREVLEHLLSWKPFEGFLFSLLLSSHSALSAEINADMLDLDELIKALNFLLKHGDKLSQLGAIEVGMRKLSSMPEIEPYLLRLVHQIRDDEVEGDFSEFKLFSSLYVLVDGELARSRLLYEEPPFYRRLASMAHAALIHRQIINSGINYAHFSEWAFNNRGEHFYMQSLVDMRIEPRWDPDMIVTAQLQAEFFGRIINIGNGIGANLVEGELRDTILGRGNQSLLERSEFPHPYYPGPLEGAEDNPNAMPSDIALIINEQLDSNKVEADSFTALVNSAMIFKVENGHAELAAKALRLGNYTLASLKDKNHLLGILSGLAAVAAVSRNSALADELRILVRRYLHDPQYRITFVEAMKMVLVASAAREDLVEWRAFVGEWLTELSFGDFGDGEGEAFQSRLYTLLHLTPELWISCSKADAALQAWCSR